MKLNTQTGFLEDTRVLDSPHFNARPETDIDLLVIHNISLPPNQFGGHYIDDLFLGKLNPDTHPYFKEIADRQVSAHLLINRQGEITQYVSLFKRAWHAGQSCWEGRKNCNDFSIGIELEGADETPFTDQQYDQLIKITKLLQQHFPKITKNRIVGHSDIAPGRKTDPGPAFDWLRLLERIED